MNADILGDGDRLTREEFLRRWEQMPDLKRAELIDGIVYMPSPVSKVHRDYHFRISYWLGVYAAATPGCGGQSWVEGKYSAGAPELIVEVSHSTAAKDRGAKLRLYERSGVREYIIVRPEQREIVWRYLEEHRYREIPADEDGLFRSRVFAGLWLDPAALWTGDLAALAAAVHNGIAQR